MSEWQATIIDHGAPPMKVTGTRRVVAQAIADALVRFSYGPVNITVECVEYCYYGHPITDCRGRCE